MVKPIYQSIETSYKGYHFRSRLVARWAVFFDRSKIKWEYEKEGCDLGELGYYIPDFWLPELKYFAEVKARYFTKIEREKTNALPYPCLLLVGVPIEGRSVVWAGSEQGVVAFVDMKSK